MGKMKIKNTSTFTIGIILDNVRYRRDLRPEQETTLPEDVVEEFNYDPGCRSYVSSGYIKVIPLDDEMEVEEVFGDVPKDTDINIADLLTKKSVQELAEVLKGASPSFKERVVSEAIRLSVSDAARCSLIKYNCGVDILKAINLQRSVANR